MVEETKEGGAPESAGQAPAEAGGGALSGKLKGLLGRKLGCTSVFRDDGRRVAVTLIEAGPCTVLDRRTPDRDGYAAVQLGFAPKKMQRVTKPLLGHFKKAQAGAFYLLREFRVPDIENYRPGQTVTASIFQPGDRVDVSGTTKGKGFQGGVKRTTGAAAAAPTARCSTGPRARSAPAPGPPTWCAATACPARWATPGARCRTSRSSRSGRRRTSS
jgi:hypothetical protein